MSMYVDDGGITAPNISLTDLEWVRSLLARHGLTLHPGKSFVARKIESRTITGVHLIGGHPFAPPAQQRKIKALSGELKKASNLESARLIARKLMGHYDHVAQIEPGFRTVAQGNRGRLLNLLNK